MTFIKSNAKRLILVFFTILIALFFTACEKKPNQDVLKMQDALNSIALGNISPARSTFALPRNTTIKHELDITWSIECEDGTADLEQRGDKWYVIIMPTAYEENEEGEQINAWGAAVLRATVSIGKRTLSREWEIDIYPGDKKIAITTIKSEYQNDDPVELTDVLVVHRVTGQGFLIQDQFGVIYVFDRGKIEVEAGDMIDISGKIGFYGDAIQIVDATVAVTSSENPVSYDAAVETTIAEILALDNENQLNFNKLFKLEGYVRHSKSGTYDRYHLETGNDKILLHYSGMSKETEIAFGDLKDKYISLSVYTFARYDKKMTLMVLPDTIQEKPEPELTDEEKVDLAISNLKPMYEGKTYLYDLELVNTAEHGVTITWTSNKPEVISNQGKFTMPSVDTEVTLTAAVSVGEYNKNVNIIVTAKAVALSTVKQVIDLVDTNDLEYVRTIGVIIGIDGNNHYYIADETGVIFVQLTVDGLVRGNKIEIIGKAKIENHTDTYLRMINEQYIIKKVDDEIHEDPLTYVDATVADFDFTITSSNIKTEVPNEEHYGKGLLFDAYVVVEGEKVYLADSLEEDAQTIFVVGHSANIGSLKSLSGSKVKAKVIVYQYSVVDGWSLCFFGRPGDVGLDEELSNQQKIDIALEEIASIVKEDDNIGGDLNFITASQTALIEGVKYVWTTDDLTTINAEGKFAAPADDKIVKITVKIYISGDTIGEADYTKEINVTALADIVRIVDIRKSTKGEAVTAIGIVTALIGNNAFIQDNTAGIYLYLGNVSDYANDLVIGNLIEVSGNFDLFNNSPQITNITSINVLGTNKTLPASVEFDDTLVLENLLALQGSLVSVTGFKIKTIPVIEDTPNHYNVIVTNGKIDLTIRVDKNIANTDYVALKNLIESLLVGQPVNFSNIPVGQYYTSPQLMLSNVGQIEVLSYADSDKAQHIADELVKKLDGKTFEAGKTIPLDTSYPSFNGTIVWLSDNTIINVETGEIGEVTEDTVVQLTATVTVGQEELEVAISVTVVKEAEITLLYHFDFEEGDTKNFYLDDPRTFPNLVDTSGFTISAHRIAVNTSTKIVGATKAIVIGPRIDNSDSIAWAEFNFGNNVVKRMEFDTYYWNSSAIPLFTKCELQVKVGEEWVLVLDILDELGTSLEINHVVLHDLDGSVFRFYAEGGTTDKNDARILLDNLKVFG